MKIALIFLFLYAGVNSALTTGAAKPRHKRGFASGYDTIGHSHEDIYAGPSLTASSLGSHGHASSDAIIGSTTHLAAAPKKAVIRGITIHKEVSVPVPQPYPVHVERRVPVPVHVPVKVPVDKPYPVEVDKPYPVYVERPVPVKVIKEIKVPVAVHVPVPVEVPVAVPVPRPVPVPHFVHKYVPIHKPYPIDLVIKEHVHRSKGWW